MLIMNQYWIVKSLRYSVRDHRIARQANPKCLEHDTKKQLQILLLLPI